MCSLISAGLWVAWSGIWLGTHQNKRIMMKLWACASSHFTLGPGFTLFPTWQGPVTKEIIIPFLDNQSQGLTFVKCPRRVCFQSSYPISSAMRDFTPQPPCQGPCARGGAGLGAVRAALRDSELLSCQSGNQSPARPAAEITSSLEMFPSCSAQNSKSSSWKWKIHLRLIPWFLGLSSAPSGTAQITSRNSFLGSWLGAGAGGGISSLDHHFILSAMDKTEEASRALKQE